MTDMLNMGCENIFRYDVQDRIIESIKNRYSFVGVNQKGGNDEAIFKTEKGDYIGIRYDDDLFRSNCVVYAKTRYLTNPMEKQTSLFWRGWNTDCTVDKLAADSSPIGDALNCIGPDARKSVRALIDILTGAKKDVSQSMKKKNDVIADQPLRQRSFKR